MGSGEEKISGTLVYRGRIINLRVDNVRLQDGNKASREVVEHAPAVGIIAEADDGDLFLVRQFRYPAGEFLLEIPAGIVEPGEKPADTARRELQEETGFDARDIVEISRFYTSPGFSNEMIILYHASGLLPSKMECDPDEFLDLVRMSETELLEAADTGKIRDSKTLSAVYWYLAKRSAISRKRDG
ncbi:MAG TPA: NUDIX hydrolase [Synergistales bacterium]|jgi:ADP-ribose pyrophosphatase|nr:NUDIX hydrolase [Synergistales bacterium]HRV71410.1 NUDIX hydrolase [Thermovirgaceae bacterium]